MMKSRSITALILCVIAIGSIQAQVSKPEEGMHTVEAFLDNTPAIYSSNLNLNDFFSNSHVTVKIFASDDSIATKIIIKSCRTTLSGNSDQYSIETAEGLLKESSKNIIRAHKWNPGKSECKVIWRARHNHKIEKKQEYKEVMSYIAELITEETKRKLHKNEGSAFMRLELDPKGRILAAGHIGNIFWGAGGTSSISSLSVSAQPAKGDNSTQNSIMFRPRVQPTRYMNEWELGIYKADKQLKHNAKKIAAALNGKQFSELAGENREIYIEIYIDTSDIEIEEATPLYPGGAKALKEYYTGNFRYNRILSRNKIKGIVEIGLVIKKNGKAKLQYVEINEPSFRYEGRNSWNKISDEISHEIKRITGNMPRWTPGIYDGKKIECKCSFRIRLNAID